MFFNLENGDDKKELSGNLIIPILASFLVCSTMTVNAFALENERCGDVLKYAGEKWETKESSAKAESAVRWFCSKNFVSMEQASSTGAEISIPVKAITIGGGFDQDSSSFRTEYHSFCSDERRRAAAANEISKSEYKLNSAVAEGVKTCLENMGTGVNAFIEEGSDPTKFLVKVRSRGVADMPVALTTDPKLNCVGSLAGWFPKLGGAGVEAACTRLPGQQITVLVKTGVEVVWWTSQFVLAQKDKVKYPACNEGGAEFVFPRGEQVSEQLQVRTVIRQAALCDIREVRYDVDCDWPESGPSWITIGSGLPESPTDTGDLPYVATLSLEGFKDGRGNVVVNGAKCQVQSTVIYANGKTVPNAAEFTPLFN